MSAWTPTSPFVANLSLRECCSEHVLGNNTDIIVAHERKSGKKEPDDEQERDNYNRPEK
jgi:hypothetical protein